MTGSYRASSGTPASRRRRRRASWERMTNLVAEFDKLPRSGETMYGFAVGVYPTDHPTLADTSPGVSAGGQPSSLASSRSRSRMTRRMTSSSMSPSRRSSTTASPLGGEQLATQPLVVERTALDRAVLLAGRNGLRIAPAEVVQAAYALGRVVPHPVLVRELLEARESGLGGVDARLRLLLLASAVVLEPEQPDQTRGRSGPGRRASRGSRRT